MSETRVAMPFGTSPPSNAPAGRGQSARPLHASHERAVRTAAGPIRCADERPGAHGACPRWSSRSTSWAIIGNATAPSEVGPPSRARRHAHAKREEAGRSAAGSDAAGLHGPAGNHTFIARPIFLSLLLLLSLFLLSCHHAHESGLARVHRTGVLRWGGDMQGGEPYVFEDPDHRGRLIGFEVELADALAHELGVRAEFVENDWTTLVPSLNRGSFDVAMNGLEITPARASQVLFTRPYYVFTLRLMARRDDLRIRGLASLQGRTVGTLANSQAWHLLQDHGANPRPYDGSNEPYDVLERGEIDAVLLDDPIVMRYAANRPRLRVVDDVAEGYYGIAAPLGDEELRHALDVALAHVTASGQLRHILDRWNIDGERQQRIVTWTDAQTRDLLGNATHARFDWNTVVLFLKAALLTLLVSFAAMALAIPFGIALALARLYGPGWLGRLCGAYIEVFRGTPVLLQLFVIYFGVATVLKLDAYTAAIVGLAMNYGAYEAEVYRAGIQAVPKGQMEAALSLGMSTPLALRRIVMPQAFRLALPSVTNDFIALLKDSSLVSVIGVVELTKRANITAENTTSWILPGALCALLYFAMSYPLSRLARVLEARMARS